MEKLQSARRCELFSCLGPKSGHQVIAYQRQQQAHKCAAKTAVNVIRRFIRYLPEARRSIVANDLTQTITSDVDKMIQGARAQGLAERLI